VHISDKEIMTSNLRQFGNLDHIRILKGLKSRPILRIVEIASSYTQTDVEKTDLIAQYPAFRRS